MCFILKCDEFFSAPCCLQCTFTRRSVRRMKRSESSGRKAMSADGGEVKLTDR